MTAMNTADLDRLARDFESWGPQRILDWASRRWDERLMLCTSFQIGGMVLIDMAVQVEPELRVFTIDTGRLPEQTHELIERVRAHYGIAVEVLMPDAVEAAEMVGDAGPNLFYESVEARLRCCGVRKVAPLRRAFSAFDAWITGARREQSPVRSTMRKIAADPVYPDLVKLAPLADWSAEALWSYVRARGVPYHDLYDHGYTSIGCAPCTRAVQAHESGRDGRWWWEEDAELKECGLHVPVLSVGVGTEA